MKRKFSRLGCGIINVENLRDALSCIEEDLDFLTRGRNKSRRKSNNKKKK